MRNQLLQNEPESASLQEMTDAPVQEFLHQLAVQITNRPAPAGASDPAGQTPAVIPELAMASAPYPLLHSWHTAPATPVVLSRRQEEIARLIAQGYPNKTIAAELAISPWTVGTYIRRIFTKVGVSSRAAMVARLLENGIIKERP